ncbi:MAG: hypothetical protein K8S54_09545 [Spirochaetia bacterium]|nr:hypothetical protein [Spirochaetia bacterium]
MRSLIVLLLLAAPLYAEPQSMDRSLIVLGIADWKGNFAVDQAGRGGLAALHTWKKQLELRVSQTGGNCILVHAGALTGADSVESFEAKLKLPAPGLTNYMDFSALGLSAEELKFVSKENPLSVAWDATEKQKKSIVIQKAGQAILLSAFSSRTQSPERAIEGILQASATEQSSFNIILAADGGAEQTLAHIPIDNVHESPEEFMKRTVIIESGSKNLFYRDPSGAFLCQVTGRTICYLEIKFRGSTITGITQRFVDLNGVNEPAAFLKPDPILMELFKKP